MSHDDELPDDVIATADGEVLPKDLVEHDVGAATVEDKEEAERFGRKRQSRRRRKCKERLMP